MESRSSRRGAPLLALCAILGVWIAARIVLAPYDGLFRYVDAASSRTSPVIVSAPPQLHAEAEQETRPNPQGPPEDHITFGTLPAMPEVSRSASRSRLTRKFPPEVHQQNHPQASPMPVRTAAEHQTRWVAGSSKLPLPSTVPSEGETPAALAPYYPVGREPVEVDRRWSADSWLLLRQGGTEPTVTGATPATYGASQAGAVLRYRIAPQSAYRPAAYVRATAAIAGAHEKEAAVGLSARPFPSVPVRAAVELRVSDQSDGQHVRPAAMVITEMPPIELGANVRAEVYGQAGYVGGNFATGFADGQLRMDAPVAEVGKGRVRAGAGAWAGAQEGASRVDVGPSATVSLPLGEHGFARLGLDWRLRLSGNAEPGSGPALTLSAGF